MDPTEPFETEATVTNTVVVQEVKDDGPHCVVYLDEEPPSIEVPVTQAEAAAVLRAAFKQSSLNRLRALDRQQAFLENPSSDPLPLEDYERLYHTAQLVTIILESGMGAAKKYCQDRELMSDDEEKLINDAVAAITVNSELWIKSAKEMAVSRYNLLFERLMGARDYKGAAVVQRCMDRMLGIEEPDDADGRTGLLKGLQDVMMEVAKDKPNPLGTKALGAASKGEKSVQEVTKDSNIMEEHDVGN